MLRRTGAQAPERAAAVVGVVGVVDEGAVGADVGADAAAGSAAPRTGATAGAEWLSGAATRARA